MKKIVLFAMLFAVGAAAVAQEEETKAKVETTIKADFVNQYIWRALDMGSVAVQPTLGVGYKGLSLTAWGSYGITNKDDVKEFDLTLAYTNGKFNVGIIDYWFSVGLDPDARYFKYGAHGTNHIFVANVPTAATSRQRHHSHSSRWTGQQQQVSCLMPLHCMPLQDLPSQTSPCVLQKTSGLPIRSHCLFSDR